MEGRCSRQLNIHWRVPVTLILTGSRDTLEGCDWLSVVCCSWKDGLFDGYGTALEHNASVESMYVGQFKQGERHGKGDDALPTHLTTECDEGYLVEVHSQWPGK